MSAPSPCPRFAACSAVLALVTLAAPAALAQTPNQIIVSSLSPSSANAGDPSLTLTVGGINFVAGSVVYWNNAPLTTVSNNGYQLVTIVPSYLLSAPGSASVTVGAPDGTRSIALTFTILVQPVFIATNALPGARATTPYSFTFTATGGSPPYSWSQVDVLPAGLILDSTGILSGIPLNQGTFNFTVRATDRVGTTAARSVQLAVGAPPLSISTAPVLSDATVGVAYTQTLTAAGGSPPYTWAAQALPVGFRLDSQSGVLSGTPTVKGAYKLTVQVSDAGNAFASKQFNLTISPPPLAITTDAPLFNGTVGSAYSQTLTATGGTPPYRWSVISGQTGDLTLDPLKGTLTGVPQNAGTISFNIQVIDSLSVTNSKSFSITMDLPKPAITTFSLPNGQAGLPYSSVLAASGGFGPYTWTLSGNAGGLTLNGATGELAGTPTAAGTFSFTVQVRDSKAQTGSRTFTLIISPSALTISTAVQFPQVIVGDPVSLAVSANGGVAPYSWTANGLPEGLAIDDASGVISGSPTKPGAYSFTIRVTDAARATSIDLFRLNVGMPDLPAVSFQSIPATLNPASQTGIQLSLDAPYTAAVTGQILLSFSPDAGGGDGTIQFSTGGRSVAFSIPAGATSAVLPAGLALQSGTVAGSILLSARLQSLGVDVGPSPGPNWKIRIDPGPPVISSVKLSVTGSGLTVNVAGFSTAREILQAKFSFGAASGSTLQNSDVTVPLDSAFGVWFGDPANARYGSQFTFTQTFNIQGNAGAVVLQSVTLSNRIGSNTYRAGQ